MSEVFISGGEGRVKMLVDRVIYALENLRIEKEADEFSLTFGAVNWRAEEKKIRKLLTSNSVPGFTTSKDPSNDDVFYVKVAKSEEFANEYAANNISVWY